MSKKGIFLGYLFFVLVVLIAFFIFSLDKTPEEGQKIELEDSFQEEKVISEEISKFIIKPGESLSEISERLKEQNFINSEFGFKIYAFLTRSWHKFWPGEYEIGAESGLKNILRILTGQPQASEKTVTIVEGLTNQQIEKILLDQELILEGEFALALEKIIQQEPLLNKYGFLSEAKENFYFPYSSAEFKLVGLQGYLFPDTYRFYQETNAEEIIRKMLDNFNQKVYLPLKNELDNSSISLFEIITMASLIEKEASLDQDRRLIADVFKKRIKVGWALESCATINYILGDPQARLTYEDTRIPSPYNTYLNAGLPPTPINNPSFSSIMAVLNPLENDYCCFLAGPEGETIFSRTIEEHNQNKIKYLK
jgi:UPF0755 protein